jgi:hypothetical protein
MAIAAKDPTLPSVLAKMLSCDGQSTDPSRSVSVQPARCTVSSNKGKESIKLQKYV